MALVCSLGLVALLLAAIPLVAVLPILLYIGVVITAQAFEATPIRHAPAIVLALVPNLAAWAQNLVDSALNAAGTSAAKLGAAARSWPAWCRAPSRRSSSTGTSARR